MFFSKIKPKHILICRNDALGDTILALPCCGIIKQYYPDVEISFLGRNYTKDIIGLCEHIDHFVNFDEAFGLEDNTLRDFFQQQHIDTAIHLRAEQNTAQFIQRTGIKYRVGNLHYSKHLKTCNRFVSFGKSKSGLNEAQLDIKMLGAIGIKDVPSRSELPNYYGIRKKPCLDDKWKPFLSKEKMNIVIHPMMTGHEREWGTDNFSKLINLLGTTDYHFIITGSKEENKVLQPWLSSLDNNIVDLTGKLSLTELLALIAHADGLVGGSTGPTHIAGAMGIHVLGLYTNRATQDAGRWGPIGRLAETLSCDNELVSTIPPEKVADAIRKWQKQS